MEDYKEFNLTPEIAAKWSKELSAIAKGLAAKENKEKAQMMYMCSLLMSDLVLRIEANQLASPFPTEPGVA